MKKFAFIAAVLTLSAGAASAADGLALAQSKNCMACHQVATKVVGPAFKEVAKKYATDKGAADKLAAKIIAGGSGNWGAVPMPPNTQVSAAEAKSLATWILSLK